MNNGSDPARSPIRLRANGQNEMATPAAAKRPTRWLYNARPRAKVAAMSRVPTTAAGKRSASGVRPKAATPAAAR